MKLLGGAVCLVCMLWGGVALAEGAVPLTSLLETAILTKEADRLPPQARLQIDLPSEAPQNAVRLLAAEHDLASSAFATIAELEGGAQVTVRGRVYALVDVPVPVRSVMPGEVAKAEDFEYRTLPAQSLGQFALADLDLIAGQEVRRTLVAGRPVQTQSLQAPRVIRRGERLTLSYSNGALELAAPGRALEDATTGDTVRVQNLNSNKTVTGIAIGEGRVQVN